MDTALLVALVSVGGAAVTTILTVLFGHLRWRREIEIKLGDIQDQISLELVRKRFKPYSVLFKQLETMSFVHIDDTEKDIAKIIAFKKLIHEAIHNDIGLLASHNTRQILLYIRSGCDQLIEGNIDLSEVILRIWALHFAMRGDLGIDQPMWSAEIGRVNKDAIRTEHRAWEQLANYYPWHKVDAALIEKERIDQKKN